MSEEKDMETTLTSLYEAVTECDQVSNLLDTYFKGAKDVSIDVFDAQTLNNVVESSEIESLW